MLHFRLLANHPEHVNIVAEWLFSEWGNPAAGHSPELLEEQLRSRMSHDALPLHLLALEDEVPVGFVALKLRELEDYPDREHWLGSLFVPRESRGIGLGGRLIEEVIKRCPDFGVSRLSLQTERLDGGIYRHHGWLDVETKKLGDDVLLIMERKIG